MSTYKWDEEWAAASGLPATGLDPSTRYKDVFEMRDGIQTMMNKYMSMIPPVEHIERSEPFPLTSFDGATRDVTRFGSATAAQSSTAPGPAIVYIHGGGCVANSVDIFAPRIAHLAGGTGLPVFAVSYRLAPEFPAPTGVEDVLAGLRLVATRPEVDPRRIVLVGDSSGGGLALGAVLLARDRGVLGDEVELARLVLVMPMLAYKTRLKEGDPRERLLTWSSASSVMAWDAYIWGKDGKTMHQDREEEGEISPYASPALAKTYQGLPPTYLEVGSLDLFCEETVEAASRMLKDGVDVEVHVWPRVPHGFDEANESSLAKNANALRFEGIRRSVGLPAVQE